MVLGEERNCESRVSFYPTNTIQWPNQDLSPKLIVRSPVYSQAMASLTHRVVGKKIRLGMKTVGGKGWPNGMWAKLWVGRYNVKLWPGLLVPLRPGKNESHHFNGLTFNLVGVDKVVVALYHRKWTTPLHHCLTW